MTQKKTEIISASTKKKQKQITNKSIEDVMVDMFRRIYFEDGGDNPKETFPTTEDLILHTIENRLLKMPFDLQRKITLEIKTRMDPYKD